MGLLAMLSPPDERTGEQSGTSSEQTGSADTIGAIPWPSSDHTGTGSTSRGIPLAAQLSPEDKLHSLLDEQHWDAAAHFARQHQLDILAVYRYSLALQTGWQLQACGSVYVS